MSRLPPLVNLSVVFHAQLTLHCECMFYLFVGETFVVRRLLKPHSVNSLVKKVKRVKLPCDSAGTISQHHGNPPDPRMQKAALARNLPIAGTARMVRDEDFITSDLILTMDKFNFSELSKLAPDEQSEEQNRSFL